MPRHLKPFPDRLRVELRRAVKRGISTYELARRSGVSRPTISLFLSQETRDITTAKGEALAKAIGLRMDLTKDK